MNHAKRIITVCIATVVAAVPLILANDSVRSYIDNHPAVAIYVPVVTGIITAIANVIAPSKSGVEKK